MPAIGVPIIVNTNLAVLIIQAAKDENISVADAIKLIEYCGD